MYGFLEINIPFHFLERPLGNQCKYKLFKIFIFPPMMTWTLQMKLHIVNSHLLGFYSIGYIIYLDD
jgi:hypothetical protein